jgi:5-methylthioribose kinase
MSRLSADPELDAFLSQLDSTGWLLPGDRTTVLSGGVSAVTVLVQGRSRSFVAKTARRHLAVPVPWEADRNRVLLEGEILRYLAGAVGPLRAPLLLGSATDPPAIAMQAVLPLPATWKAELVGGALNVQVLEAVVAGMAALHVMPIPDVPGFAEVGTTLQQLRIEPFYLRTAALMPQYAADLVELSGDLSTPLRRHLTHGDFTPKNVLLTPAGPVLVDFETVHDGQPALDVAMLSAHLILKALLHGRRRPEFIRAAATAAGLYRSMGGVADEHMSSRHAGAVVLARLFGSSRVEYLAAPSSRRRGEQLGAALLRAEISLRDVDARFESLDPAANENETS